MPEQPDQPFARAFRRAGRIVLGDDVPMPQADAGTFDPAETRQVMTGLRRQRAHAMLADAMARGESLESAAIATVKALSALGERPAARAIALSLQSAEGGARAGSLARLVAAHFHLGTALAYDEMGRLDDADLARWVPVEAVDTCLQTGTDEARRRALAVAARVDLMAPTDAVDVAGRLLAFGETEAARQVRAGIDGRDAGDRWTDRHDRALAALDRYLTPDAPAQVPAGAVPVGVIDYDQPDQGRASRNVGDYIQTLAMLGNLARLSDVEYTGVDGLGELMDDLQARVKPELRMPGPGGRIHLVELDRDFSSAGDLPEETFTIAFGWHMHSLFGLRYDFPYHPHVRPLFVSFHVNRPEFLTDEAVDYLRAYGPIGCRDWTTVDLLLSAGVEAFFSGCITTTVDAVFPPTGEVRREGDLVAVIDAPLAAAGKVQREVEELSHGGQSVRLATLGDGVRAASRLLARYQSHYHRVVTSRLHSYLPATSLGVPVKFTAAGKADPRFEGLTGLTPGDPAFTSMRDGIRDLLAGVLPLVAAGRPAAEVYARWREQTAPYVRAARERFQRPVPDLPAIPGLLDRVAAVRQAAVELGDHDGVDPAAVTDVTMSVDHHLLDQIPVTIEAVVSHASTPVRLWITCRGLQRTDMERLAAAFAPTPMTFLPCDDVAYGEDSERLLAHTTVTTIDRLLLPELLPGLDTVVYVDIDALALDDVAELARTDLDGRPFAARDFVRIATQTWRGIGEQLPQDRAYELWHRLAVDHPFGYRTINAGVLVLGLARMRADRFTERFVPWVPHYGFNDQDVLLAYAGGDRVRLDPRWNTWPALEPTGGAAIVHYLGAAKPWLPRVAESADVWRHYAARAERRLREATARPGEGAAR